MISRISKVIRMALVSGAILAFSAPAFAASCCGGGSAASLLLPKFGKAMVDTSFSTEKYDGFWNNKGEWRPDPAGSALYQYRMTFGAAYRLADNWQASFTIPYVWNDNKYSGLRSRTDGLGDSTVTVWYEAFDNITCIWNVQTLEDLKPAIYFGATLTVPTGISPYDDVNDNFDITGRGFYRLDGSILLDKTIYPWNFNATLTYGTHFKRPVNREYGTYVAPYSKQLGDRASGSVSVGYTHFTSAMSTFTFTAAYADMWEDYATIDGSIDSTSGLRKKSVAGTVAWASDDRDWIVKGTWSHAIQSNGWGRNFPTTDVFTVGVSHVFR